MDTKGRSHGTKSSFNVFLKVYCSWVITNVRVDIMAKVEFICVDLQNDFSLPGGKCWQRRRSVEFIQKTLFPFFNKMGIMVSEIISDYRQPRPGDDRNCCRLGDWGYESLLPDTLRKGGPWIKCMNSPLWTRSGIGDQNREPGLPSQDTTAFDSWLKANIGAPEDINGVVIFGLTADCCVLALVQELRWRGYDISVLSDATDVRSGDLAEKQKFLSDPPFTFWGKSIDWERLKTIL